MIFYEAFGKIFLSIVEAQKCFAQWGANLIYRSSHQTISLISILT